jgi:deoxycytidine triphosphate deaminase
MERAMQQQFAQSTADAQARFEKWSSTDPYPSVAPALLSSVEITDYVAATGMIFPFHVQESGRTKLKPASYEVDLLGKLVYWDDDGAKREQDISQGQPFMLRRNSISFLELEPELRIPDYIALRFNLKIKHVYRGLLLGTGPLVDPGFCGKLFIPLHNLTDTDYFLRGGDGLIWMEFTKVSWPPPGVSKESPNDAPLRLGTYVQFPPAKRWMTLEAYLRQSGGEEAIRSSIPVEIHRSRAAAEESKKAAEDARKRVDYVSIANIVALVLGLLGIVFVVYQMGSIIMGSEQSIQDAVREMRQEQKDWELVRQDMIRRIEQIEKTGVPQVPEKK